jgi:predicted dehydrogenase
VGCYPISYARSVIGSNPLEVSGWQVTGPTGVDETFVGQMRFDRDIFVQFDSSFVTPLHAFMEIVGSEGTLIIPTPFKPGIEDKIYLTRGDKTETITNKGQELYLGEVEDMADAILLGREPRISLEDSRANVAVITALLESVRSGQIVKLT